MLHCSEGHTKAPHEMPYSAPLPYDLCQRDIVSIMSSYSKELYSTSNCITYVGYLVHKVACSPIIEGGVSRDLILGRRCTQH